MDVVEMQDNIIGRFGLEAEETVLFFKACERFKEDNVVNRTLLKVCHDSLLGIVNRKRVEETKKLKEEKMKKAVELMIEKDLGEN